MKWNQGFSSNEGHRLGEANWFWSCPGVQETLERALSITDQSAYQYKEEKQQRIEISFQGFVSWSKTAVQFG